MSLRAAAARTDSQVLDSDVSVSHETESSKAKSSIESTSTASQSGFRYTSRAFHNASRRAFFLRPGSIRPRNLPAPLAASEVIHAPPGKSPRSKADTSYHRRARSDDPVRSILSQLDDAPQVPEDSAGAVLARTLQARRECAAGKSSLCASKARLWLINAARYDAAGRRCAAHRVRLLRGSRPMDLRAESTGACSDYPCAFLLLTLPVSCSAARALRSRSARSDRQWLPLRLAARPRRPASRDSSTNCHRRAWRRCS
jgi:hypothetical protein